MYRILIADDDYEDRELLRLEIERALADIDRKIKFFEATSVRQAIEILGSQPFDLLTLDIEFDRLTEGIEALPEIFERFPTLNVIVVSGKLSKAEVTAQLFRFTKDNVLKGKRWARHFDVLDKRDDKTEAIRRAHAFSFRHKEVVSEVHKLILEAEGCLDANDTEKCLDVYRKIQSIVPGEEESRENLRLFEGAVAYDQALDYLRRGERVVAALLLGHHLEGRLKAYTRRALGRRVQGLADGVRELEASRRISPVKKRMFHNVMRLRNKAIHHPLKIDEDDFESVLKDLTILESDL